MPPKRPSRLRVCPCCSKTFSEVGLRSHQMETEAELQRVEADVGRLALFDPGHVSPPQPPPQPSVEHDHTIVYRELRSIDNSSSAIHVELVKLMDTWDKDPSPGSIQPFVTRTNAAQYIRRQIATQLDQASRVKYTNYGGDRANELYGQAIVQTIDEKIDMIEARLETWSAQDRDNGLLRNDPRYFDTSQNFTNPLNKLTPAATVVMFLAVALNLIANITQRPCDFVLRLAKLALCAALGIQDGRDQFPDIPDTIRTARARFHLDPITTVYAVCGCGKLHPPTSNEDGLAVYPSHCVCGNKLTKLGHNKDGAIRVPSRPYVMQDFRSFCGSLYCRPGVEALIRRQARLPPPKDGEVWDIYQASAIQDLKGPDGKQFIQAAGEIRTVWSLSYDGYNPLTNKTSGKTTSVGSLAMVCNSLPPALRNRPEYMFLVGIIPGPQQPKADGLNPYLAPLVDELHDCFYKGNTWSRTYESPTPVKSREALVTSVNDLPAARKIVGAAGHSAEAFCMYCHLPRSDINNIDTSTWPPKNGKDFRAAAYAWKDATSKTQRKKLYKTNGVRWSELLRLEYWNPVEGVVIDGMHTLLLGLVRHHFREVIGTKWDERAADEGEAVEATPHPKELKKGSMMLRNPETTHANLKKLSLPVLRHLCRENGVVPTSNPSRRRKKLPFVEALMTFLKQTRVTKTTQHPPSQCHLIEGDFDKIQVELGHSTDSLGSEPMLDTEALKSIQDTIKQIVRPTSQAPPPHNFGSPSHGKLKADQWRTCIDFDLPVALVKLWAMSKDGEIGEMQRKALQSTFLLSMALRFAVSQRTTPQHREKYTTYMNTYLATVKELRPLDDLHPIHHNAIHLADFLERFGPIHGWWMFPFERLIGVLQRVHTNFRFGEWPRRYLPIAADITALEGQLEGTVMNTFCSASKLKVLLQDPSNPPVVQQCLKITEACFPNLAKGSMLLMDSIDATEARVGEPKRWREQELDAEVAQLLSLPTSVKIKVQVTSRIEISGRQFATDDVSRSSSHLFFYPSPSRLVPAVLRQIIRHNNTTHLIVHEHAEQRASFFDQYPDFGATARSKALVALPSVITLPAQVYSANLVEWDAETMVLRPLMQDF